MGIYSDGKVYGLKWGKFNENENEFEKIYETEMTNDNIKEVKEVYDNIIDSNDFIFCYYTKCSSTYDNSNNTFMTWWSISKGELNKWFAEKL